MPRGLYWKSMRGLLYSPPDPDIVHQFGTTMSAIFLEKKATVHRKRWLVIFSSGSGSGTGSEGKKPGPKGPG